MKIGKREFNKTGDTYIWGILNLTPDSFSDGGQFQNQEDALRHVEQMIIEGADIIDVGGESTRPGYRLLSEEEEIDRIAPVIESLKSHFDIPISLDTYKAKVAKAGILAGADLINDIWGLKYDKHMAALIAEYNIPCCLMHNRENPVYSDFMSEVKSDLKESVEIALKAGIKKENIILDPGVGFAKTYEQNLEVIKRVEELHELGYPLLMAASRKSVIGNALNLPVSDRLEGTLAISAFAVWKGCSFVRVHDVKENARLIQMAKLIK
ncbi:dihydropteroate synthase [Lachnospiraceae bacterium OttesenSCG-928-D06]|nr:dihydropteroate synthase [Lachnospiraceae bacterium OttesenSCG-928-D06]